MKAREIRTLEIAYDIERAVIRRSEIFGTHAESWGYENTRQYRACIRLLSKYAAAYQLHHNAMVGFHSDRPYTEIEDAIKTNLSRRYFDASKCEKCGYTESHCTCRDKQEVWIGDIALVRV